MKIYVNEIMPEGIDREEKLDASKLSLETEHVRYPAAIIVTARIERDKDIITANCKIESRTQQICSRCLLEFDSPIEKKISFIYKVKGEHTIELDDNIRDAIILDYPMKILCRPDCKGLCFNCGKNLNEGPCGCNVK